MAELKPCPFCGGKVTLIYRSADMLYHVYHAEKENEMTCSILEPFNIDAISLRDARDTWNRREGGE